MEQEALRDPSKSLNGPSAVVATSSLLAMADHNDTSYSPPPSNGYADASPFGPPSSPHPTSPRRNRYTHASVASWTSEPFRAMNGMSPPPIMSPRIPSSAGSRPLPVPSSYSRATSDLQVAHSPPSEVDITPRPFFTMTQASDDRDWEPEEAMTIGSPSEEGYSYREGQEQQPPPEEQMLVDDSYDNSRHIISLDDPNGEPIALLSEPGPNNAPASGRKPFVGGFMATLTRPLKAVAKSSLFDRGATRKGAPGTAHSTGDSHFVPAPAYDEPGAHVSYIPPMDMSAAQKPPTELPYSEEPSRRLSLARSARRASSQVQSPRSVMSHSIPPDTPRFMSEAAVLAHPDFASDYAKMEPPPGPPDDSFSAHITRARNFFTELKNLPWVSDRIALDYRPTQSSRARVGKNKVSGSWYTRKHQDLDLLAPGPGSARQATIHLRSDAGHSTAPSTHSRSTSRAHQHGLQGGPPQMRTPLSFMTSPATLPSPGASSHGQGAHAMSFSYYFAPPQPLYVYSSPMASPLPPVAEGSQASSSSPGMPQHPHPQAVPMYVMSGLPPGLVPATPPPPVAQVPRSHARATSPTSGVPPTQRSSHSRHSGSNTH